METYRKYKNARDLSWRLLIDFKLTSFPLDVVRLIWDLGKELRPYGNNKDALKKLKPDYRKVFAFSYKDTIFYDEKAYFPHFRFMLAHEFGHVLLGHTAVNWEYSAYDDNQANIFARCLIMPAIVCKNEGLRTAQQIHDFFGVAKKEAQYRRDRLEILYEMNRWNTSQLETEYEQIYKQAKGFRV